MIIAGVYFLIILFLIYKNGFFGIFRDNKVTPIQFSLFFVFKCLAIPVFYWVYEKQYGGIDQYDAGIFFKDSKIINGIAYSNFTEYIKLLFGFQDDSEGSYLYTNYLTQTFNWDDGKSWRLFFNDNRTMIRVHSLIQFISFGSYFVHALLSCLLSFIGIVFIYRTFKHLFVSNELWVIAAFIFLPNLWLFTGALLKEPLVLFNMGVVLWHTKKLLETNQALFFKIAICGLITAIIYCLKPQVTGTVFLFYLLYHVVEKRFVKKSSVWFLGSLILAVIILNFAFLAFKHVSIPTFINKKQAEFYDVMNGGLFLKDKTKFVRLPYDTSLIKLNKQRSKNNITIKHGVSFYYWEDAHQADTMFCKSNTDTLQTYSLIYKIVPANSGYKIEPIKGHSALSTIAKSMVYAIVYPFKFNSLVNIVVSLESLFLMICLLLAIVALFYIKHKLPIIFFLSLFLTLIILFGIATPNTGAILRYRSIITPFILLAVIYILQQLKTIKLNHDAGRIHS